MLRRMLSAWFFIGFATAGVFAAEKSAAELLPATTVAYVEISQPQELLAIVLDHPLKKQLESLPEVQKAEQAPPYRQFLKTLGAFEKKSGMSARDAVEALTHGGIYFGFDALTQSAVTLVQAKDAATLDRLTAVALEMARDEARREGRDDPVQVSDYNGLKQYRIGDGWWIAAGPWLVLSNKDRSVRRIVDSYRGADDDGLASNEDFRAARLTMVGRPAAWSYLNLSVLRSVGFGKEIFGRKSDNPVGELLAGGVVSTLAQAPFMTSSLEVDRDRAALSVALPHDASWTPKTRQYFFGAAGATMEPKQTLFSLATYRDVGKLWLLKEDLFTEPVVAQLTQADGNLTTLFSGRNFGREILGAVRPEIQFLLVRQTFAGSDLPEPDIKLPAGALVFRLKEPEKMQRPLKVLFQSLIGFLNVAGSQQGQAPLEQDTEKLPQGQLVSARYLPMGGEGKINYNFSPSVAFVGDRFIVSSAASLARDLAALAGAADQPPAADSGENTRAIISVPALRDVLQDNRKHLVAQAALNDGSSNEQAEKGIDGLMSVLALGRSLSLRLITAERQIQLQAELKLATP